MKSKISTLKEFAVIAVNSDGENVLLFWNILRKAWKYVISAAEHPFDEEICFFFSVPGNSMRASVFIGGIFRKMR
ncbi:MAG: hypothetical protein IJ449_11510 [Clostridia bacterium]|nr:hypothetical protein [Clostridia bacterium]